MKIFLSGAVENITSELATGWRQTATRGLEAFGYKVIDPTITEICDFKDPKEIVEKNLLLQKQADIILVEYLIPDRPYIGTDFELTHAKLNGQPVIAFACDQAKSRVYFNYLATRIEDTLQDAISYIVKYYPPKNTKKEIKTNV